MSVEFAPTGDRVIIKRDPKVEKVGEIHVPDVHQDYPLSGTVVAIGPEVMYLRPEMRVRYPKFIDNELIEGYIICREDDIYAVELDDISLPIIDSIWVSEPGANNGTV